MSRAVDAVGDFALRLNLPGRPPAEAVVLDVSNGWIEILGQHGNVLAAPASEVGYYRDRDCKVHLVHNGCSYLLDPRDGLPLSPQQAEYYKSRGGDLPDESPAWRRVLKIVVAGVFILLALAITALLDGPFDTFGGKPSRRSRRGWWRVLKRAGAHEVAMPTAP